MSAPVVCYSVCHLNVTNIHVQLNSQPFVALCAKPDCVQPELNPDQELAHAARSNYLR